MNETPDGREPADPDSDRARAPRTNLLLAATIDSGSIRSGGVRIRNLSDGGAMLEGAALPEVDETLTLKRGDLAIGASVAWRIGPRCGVRFDRKVSVLQWASTIRPQAGGLPGPVRVDRTQPPAVPPAASASDKDLDHRVAEELAYIGRLLQSMGDTLVDEPMIVQRHPDTLQNFDVATQILRHLAAVLSADDRRAAIAEIGMDDLRARLLRKPLF